MSHRGLIGHILHDLALLIVGISRTAFLGLLAGAFIVGIIFVAERVAPLIRQHPFLLALFVFTIPAVRLASLSARFVIDFTGSRLQARRERQAERARTFQRIRRSRQDLRER